MDQRSLLSSLESMSPNTKPRAEQVNQGLNGIYRDVLSTYWQAQLRHLEDAEHDYKQQQLPLARIKKVMKADPEVKMISAEAPILFAKGCDMFITELTMRAWIHAEENKRRTLQRSDIASALSKSDMFDFLIDIVPREEANQSAQAKRPSSHPQPTAPATMPAQMAPPPQAHHASEYGFAPPPPQQGHMEGDQFRGAPMYGMPPPPQGQPEYGHPGQQPMFDQSAMYNQYAMAPQQVCLSLTFLTDACRGPVS